MRAITRRVSVDLSRRGFIAGATSTVALLGLSAYSGAKAQVPTNAILFTNARLFDGVNLNIREGVSVLVADRMIVDVVQSEIAPPDGATVIDAGGRTLKPGLIDGHWHSMMASLPMAAMLSVDATDIHFAAAGQAERTLMRGFTTVRDMGGIHRRRLSSLRQGTMRSS